MPDPICPYCNQPAVLIDTKLIYGRSYGKAWNCEQCKAYVGCHTGTTKPLGRLADKELRAWKMKAHVVFDNLWKRKLKIEKCSKSSARKAGYKWLAKELDLSSEKCHIGMMDVDQCKKVVDVCSPHIKF